MLFLRSPGGLSHHPDETVREEDVAAALASVHQPPSASPPTPSPSLTIRLYSLFTLHYSLPPCITSATPAAPTAATTSCSRRTPSSARRFPASPAASAIVHVSPAAGAAFTQMTVELEPGGTLTQGPAQRFLYVLEGDLTLSEPDASSAQLAAGSYAYLPPAIRTRSSAQTTARVAVIEKPYLPLDEITATRSATQRNPFPWFLIGHEPDLPSTALNGDEALQVRSLLPDILAFDFACNTMTYQPGAALSQVEIHYMEHGLLMLQGGGIYRLGDHWYPTRPATSSGWRPSARSGSAPSASSQQSTSSTKISTVIPSSNDLTLRRDVSILTA